MSFTLGLKLKGCLGVGQTPWSQALPELGLMQDEVEHEPNLGQAHNQGPYLVYKALGLILFSKFLFP
jgi:hypothetical protein